MVDSRVEKLITRVGDIIIIAPGSYSSFLFAHFLRFWREDSLIQWIYVSISKICGTFNLFLFHPLEGKLKTKIVFNIFHSSVQLTYCVRKIETPSHQSTIWLLKLGTLSHFKNLKKKKVKKKINNQLCLYKKKKNLF